MYCSLVKSYVDSINNGAVPNVENAWSNICQNECYKAESCAINNYDQVTFLFILYNLIKFSNRKRR